MDTPPTISVIAPMNVAWEHMKRMLFEPFDFKKWLIIGFSCFLANVASYSQSGGNFSGPNTSDTSGGGGDFISSIESIFGEYVGLVFGLGIFLIVVLAILLIALTIGLLWVSCRGTFMFMDNVARDRAEISAPWKAYGPQAWQLFYFYLIVGGGFIALCILAGVLAAVLVKAEVLNAEIMSFPFIIPLVGIFAVVLITFVVLLFFVKAIAIPRMYIQKCGILRALKDSWSLFCDYPLEWILFFFVSIGLAIASAVLVIICCLFTCCLAILPYINQVLMLPMYVFLQVYGLAFLAQFGPAWNALSENSPPLPNDARTY